MREIPLWLVKSVFHLALFTPLAWLYLAAFSDSLGADPVEAVIHFTGIGAFNVLIFTLLVSPLAKRFKWSWLMQCRRLIGLYAFVYALCHVANFFLFELQLDISLFVAEVIKRPYISLGMLAFVIMLALTLTSPFFVRRKMAKSWQSLHNLIYPMAVLIGIHFYWSVKSELIEPSIYLLVVTLLLFYRRKRICQWLKLN